jgi:hypothetical protein
MDVKKNGAAVFLFLSRIFKIGVYQKQQSSLNNKSFAFAYPLFSRIVRAHSLPIFAERCHTSLDPQKIRKFPISRLKRNFHRKIEIREAF